MIYGLYNTLTRGISLAEAEPLRTLEALFHECIHDGLTIGRRDPLLSPSLPHVLIRRHARALAFSLATHPEGAVLLQKAVQLQKEAHNDLASRHPLPVDSRR